MIEYKIADEEDFDLLMSSRLEMLKVVNDLDEAYEFSDELVEYSKLYFKQGDQVTVLALDQEIVVGCATICFMTLMPTFSHPTGKRAHLMNVYTKKEYRGRKIASHMMEMIIQASKEHGATEISLDATTMGRPLYEKFGFKDSTECMVYV